MNSNVSDDASGLLTAEHVIRATVAGASVTGVDWGFSFNAVTNTLAGDAQDDDAGLRRTVQGSLRQFIENANAISGANSMRFVPTEATNATDGGGNDWWRLSVTQALPAITDGNTAIDGTAYDSADGTTVLNTNSALLGFVGFVGLGADAKVGTGDEMALTGVQGPELEIINDRASNVLPIGLDVQNNNITVRDLAISGFGSGDLLNDANIRVGLNGGGTNFTGVIIEGNVIGTNAASFTDNVAVTAGQVIDVADINARNLIFTPDPDDNGAGYANFDFTVTESGAAFDSAVLAGNDGTVPLVLPTISGGTDELYVVVISMRSNQTVISISGGGLTWTKQIEQRGGRGTVDFAMYTAYGSPADFQLSITTDTANSVAAVVGRYSGTDGVIYGVAVSNTQGQANGPGTDLAPVNDAPVITSGATPSVPENTTAVTTVTATDADGDTPTFSITGGVDAGLFAINGTSGALTFSAAPDFELPGDANTDNVYEVQVTADDGNGGTTAQLISVTVTGTMALAQTALLTFTGGADGTDAMIFTGTMADINAALDGMTFTPNPGYQGGASVQVSTNDLGNTGVIGGPQITVDMVNITVTNTAPTLADQTITVDENSPLGSLVGTVIASDPDLADPLTYTIVSGNAAGAFSIDAATGQIRVANPALLDFEINPTFTLQVQVTDSGTPGLSGTAFVTIQLNDPAEGAVTPPGPGPIPPPPPPPPPPEPEPEPEPDPAPEDEVDLGGGDEGGGGSPAPEPTPEPVPEPVPVPVVEAAPEPVVEVVVAPEPEPVVVKTEREPREKAEKPKLKVVDKAMDVNRVPDTTTPFRQALDIMSEGVGTTDILDEVQNNTLRTAFKGSSFVLSAGFLTWALRGVSLLASVAASLPAWQGFDPLPVLAAKKRYKKKDEERDDNGDDKNDDDWQEKRLQRLFNPMDSTGDD